VTAPTDKIINYFNELNTIPRCSKNEAGVCRWLQHWAEGHGFSSRVDAAGNLVVRVPAGKGYEAAPPVVIQGHMDMVCEKTPDSTHDFSKDPIVSHRDGEWITAADTTLGADNGIAIAYAMVMAEDTIDRPALELLFTVDEETGLNGAKELPPDFIDGRILINLDSEDEGIFTIGCAGGIDTRITLPFSAKTVPEKKAPYRLSVGKLRGGHSGIDIHKGRGNANKILARLLTAISDQTPLRLSALKGGSKKNAIPRDAEALFYMDASRFEAARKVIRALELDIVEELRHTDPGIAIDLMALDRAPGNPEGLSERASRKVLDLLLALPNGVYGISAQAGGAVETSCNLAVISLAAGSLTITSSQRSAAMSRLAEMTAMVHAVASLAGAETKDMDSYPPWPPDMRSRLLERSIEAFRTLYGRAPEIQVIHAGLECAVIGSLFPGMEMISFGPTIRNPHSPGERLHVPSIENVWGFLLALLRLIKPATKGAP
jgi:dipeptidase D